MSTDWACGLLPMDVVLSRSLIALGIVELLLLGAARRIWFVFFSIALLQQPSLEWLCLRSLVQTILFVIQVTPRERPVLRELTQLLGQLMEWYRCCLRDKFLDCRRQCCVVPLSGDLFDPPHRASPAQLLLRIGRRTQVGWKRSMTAEANDVKFVVDRRRLVGKAVKIKSIGAGTSSAGNFAQVAKDAMLDEESFTRGSVVMEMGGWGDGRLIESARLQFNLPAVGRYLDEEARPAELAEERSLAVVHWAPPAASSAQLSNYLTYLEKSEHYQAHTILDTSQYSYTSSFAHGRIFTIRPFSIVGTASRTIQVTQPNCFMRHKM
ncbi:hypothetical protein KC350_g84 [Hortaea werneckii]|nr:hypothetical protein KC350_g84 [Hortaea werneckii]